MKNPRETKARDRVIEVAAGLTLAGVAGVLLSIPVASAWRETHPDEPAPASHSCITTDPAHPDQELTASCQVGSVENRTP